MSQNFTLDISWTSIFKLAISLFLLYLVYLTGSLLILLLFALIISTLFSPLVDFLEQKRLPRGAAVVLVYGFTFGAIGFLLSFSVPVFVYEFRQFVQQLPDYFDRFAPPLRSLGIESFKDFQTFSEDLQNLLIASSTNIFSAVFSIFGGIFTTLFVITAGIFISLERHPIESAISLLSPKEYEEILLQLWQGAKKKVAGWFLSHLLASLFVALASFIAFAFLGLEFAVSLSMVAGLLNLIPYLGPVVSGILIFLLPGLQDAVLGLLAVLIFVIIQQLESNIITPLLTKRFVGLSPVFTLLAFAIGATLWGILGAILTIPLLAVVIEFVRGFMEFKKGRVEPQEIAQGEEVPIKVEVSQDKKDTKNSDDSIML